MKGVTELDLTALVISSEGTLGVIVDATLRLRRRIEGTVCTIAATLPDVRAAASGVQPAIMELMDTAILTAVYTFLQLPGPRAGDGAADHSDRRPVLAAVLRDHSGETAVTADAHKGERFLKMRQSMHAAMATLGTTLIEDVSMPRNAMPAMFDEIAGIERTYGLTIPAVAHAGDGNLHPNFVFEGPEPPAHV